MWVKLHILPLYYYNESTLYRLGSTIGNVLRIHPDTRNLTQQVFAKLCIEMDVTKPFLDSIWIGTSKYHSWKIDLEYQGNQAFSTFCGLLGHTVGLCRKKQQILGKAVVDDKSDKRTPNPKAPQTNRTSQWITKTTRLAKQTGETSDKHDASKPHGGPEPKGILKRHPDGIS